MLRGFSIRLLRQVEQPCFSGHRRGLASVESERNGNPYPLPSAGRATPYDIFHIGTHASAAEIKARYYDLVKIYHPDRALAGVAHDGKTGDQIDVQKAHDNFKRITEAYTVLSDERRRRMYDRAGVGWDPTSSSSSGSSMSADVPVWTGSYPRSPSEWAAYQAWSDAVGRSAPGSLHRRSWEFHRAGPGGGHDRFGWQSYAGNPNNPGADWFYGYGHANRPRYTDASASGPRYTSNARFIASVASLTLVLSILQYGRFQQERRMILGVDDKRHVSAVESLQQARKFARSDVGRMRMEGLRKRAREQQQQQRERGEQEMNEQPMAVSTTINNWQGIVGRGGPSGKEANDRRMKRLESGVTP